MISPKMKEILRLFHKDQELTKAVIVQNCGLEYYHNAEKYIGETLSRMVKSGLLERVKPGVFKLGKPEAKNRKSRVPSVDDGKNLNLF